MDYYDFAEEEFLEGEPSNLLGFYGYNSGRKNFRHVQNLLPELGKYLSAWRGFELEADLDGDDEEPYAYVTITLTEE